jgi:hypothetical protein
VLKLSALERHGVDIICLAVPSEALNAVMFTSHGKGFEYWALLSKQGGSVMEFESMCRGGKVLEKAVQQVTAKANEGRKKDQLRAQVAALILKAISEYILSFSGSKTDRHNRRNNPRKDRPSKACATQAWRADRGHEDPKAALGDS